MCRDKTKVQDNVLKKTNSAHISHRLIVLHFLLRFALMLEVIRYAACIKLGVFFPSLNNRIIQYESIA